MNTINLHTDGGEFFIDGTTTDYIGYYNLSSDGIYYSERSLIETSVKLLHIPENVKTYNSIASPTLSSVVAYVPTPTDSDYQQGWFTRYFARQTNDKAAPYIEIDESQYNEILGGSKPLYIGVSIRWKISGPKEDILDPMTMKVTEPGVINTNNRSIKKLETTHSGLVFRLQNLTEFWKGDTSVFFGPALDDGLDGTLRYSTK